MDIIRYYSNVPSIKMYNIPHSDESLYTNKLNTYLNISTKIFVNFLYFYQKYVSLLRKMFSKNYDYVKVIILVIVYKNKHRKTDFFT